MKENEFERNYANVLQEFIRHCKFEREFAHGLYNELVELCGYESFVKFYEAAGYQTPQPDSEFFRERCLLLIGYCRGINEELDTISKHLQTSLLESKDE